MKTDKYYFRDEDSTMCHPLDYFDEGDFDDDDDEKTLIEAVPDNDTKDFIYCGLDQEVSEKSMCKKSECRGYTSKSGRGVCARRGKLYTHGEKVYLSDDFKIIEK